MTARRGRMVPAERAARESRGGPDGSNEISPATTAALLARFSARPAAGPQQARQAAADLIRCMDRRDQAGAEALLARVGRGAGGQAAVDAVLAFVWHLEALRAGRARQEARREAQQREWLGIAVALLAGAVADDEAAAAGKEWRRAA